MFMKGSIRKIIIQRFVPIWKIIRQFVNLDTNSAILVTNVLTTKVKTIVNIVTIILCVF